MAPLALNISGVTKRYPGVVALRDVSLEARAGEIHALVGENGAGKSTLIGVAAGSVSADAGSIEIDGARLNRADPLLAAKLGVAVVYQHPAVLPDLTVAENLWLGVGSNDRPPAHTMKKWARERLASVGSNISPDLRVDELNPAGRHFVELARAISLKPKVLILDEPTEPFSAGEIEALFILLKRLRDEGCCIIYISHRLPDVRRISERITVLRDGHIQGTFDTAEVTEERLVEFIVGGRLEAQFPGKLDQDVRAGTTLAVSLQSAVLTDVEFEVLPGEILGLAGIDGNGQRDAVRVLAGVQAGKGRAVKGSDQLDFGSSTAALRAGIVHIPADRRTEGLFGSMSVKENTSVHRLGRLAKLGVVSPRREKQFVEQMIRDFEVKTPTVDTTVESLSGGNQQKVLVSRSISAEPRVLLADEPTAGVDVGTRAQIYTALRQAATEGASVIVTSSDAAELAGLSDRVAVFSSGRIVKVLTGIDVTEDQIVGTALAASPARREHVESNNRRGFQRFLSGDYLPTVMLAVVGLVLVIAAASSNPLFLSARNLTPMLSQIAVLGLVALGQATVLMIGGVDLSVGPLMGLSTVIASFVLPAEVSGFGLISGIFLILLVGAAVGLVNGLLVRYANITPIVATLVTFIGLQGISLLLRPSAAGTFSQVISSSLDQGFGFVPGAFIVVTVVALAGEYALRRTRWGVKLRAVGSDELASLRSSGSAARTQLGAYILCSVIASLAGILLVAQNGTGDPTSGITYTLTSITAVILGGASLTGGRGTYIGPFIGAVLLTLAISATTFFGLDLAWQIAAPGILILVSAALYSRARSAREAS